MRLLLTANIKTLLDVTPADYAHIRIKRGQRWDHTFNLISSRNRPFKITKVVIPDGKFSVTHGKIKQDQDQGFGYEIKVSLTGNIPIGPVREEIKIHTDLPGASTAEIRIFGKVEGPISYYPERLSFYPNPRVIDGQFSATVNLATSEKAFHIQKVENLAEGMKWAVIPVEKGRRYVLAFIWTGKEIKKRIYGEAVIFTDNDDMPEITIPYNVFPNKGN